MKRDVRKILVLCLFSIMLISFVAGVVNAQATDTTSTTNLQDSINSGISGIGQSWTQTWTSWKSGADNPELLKYLYLILIAVLVYSILTTIKFVKSKAIKWVIAAIIAFIATMYINTTDLYALGQVYGAFGLTLGVILPFLILSFFTFSAAKEGSVDVRLIQWIMWWVFFAFLLYKTAAEGFKAPLVIATLAALGMALLNHSLIAYISETYIKEVVSISKNIKKLSVAEDRQQAEAQKKRGEDLSPL